MNGSLLRTAAVFTWAGLVVAGGPLAAQWTHRYPKVDGYSHHVYLEGYELPTLAAGPLDAAPGPEGRRIAFAARGWLWLLDLDTGIARQLTSGAGLDSRPAWSPDGRRLAFVRDDGSDTRIVLLELANGREEVVVDEPALDLDPAFGPDGRSLYYSSAVAGDLDLWRLELASGEKTRLTDQRGIEIRPQPHPDGRRVVYVAKRGGPDRVVVRELEAVEDEEAGETGEAGREAEPANERILHQGAILSQLRPALSPDGRLVAFQTPAAQGDGWELRLASVDAGGPTVMLAGGPGRLPLTPAWSADGSGVYFSEATRDEEIALFRVPAVGGDVVAVPARAWTPAGPTGRLLVRTRLGGGGPVAARLNVAGPTGHPLFAAGTQPASTVRPARSSSTPPGSPPSKPLQGR